MQALRRLEAERVRSNDPKTEAFGAVRTRAAKPAAGPANNTESTAAPKPPSPPLPRRPKFVQCTRCGVKAQDVEDNGHPSCTEPGCNLFRYALADRIISPGIRPGASDPDTGPPLPPPGSRPTYRLMYKAEDVFLDALRGKWREK
jgi:hypothetical protein